MTVNPEAFSCFSGRFALQAPFGSPLVVEEIRAYLVASQLTLAALGSTEDVPVDGEALGRKHARAMDQLLRPLMAAAMKAHPLPNPVTLVAVGSYGRGAVACGSDLDVRLLVESKKADSQLTTFAEAFLYPLWDAGLAVGHQVVSVDDLLLLARTDLPTATSILDARFLAGDERPCLTLREQARRGLFCDAEVREFLARLAEEVRGRHGRFGDSVYLLEPDVKNGAGGLRDIDVAGWIAGARWATPDMGELVRAGVLVAREAEALSAAREFLWRLRQRLHRLAARRSDRLTFDQQEQLAPDLGYGQGGPAVEALMSAYYRHARTVLRIQNLLFGRAVPLITRRRPHEEDLGHGLHVFDGQVSLTDPAQLERDPALALRLYAMAVAKNRPLYPFARDAVARATEDDGFAQRLRQDPEAAGLFVDLCTRAQETKLQKGSILADMHEAGLVVAMVPEFAPVVGRVHHDVYHVYTVDVHSVAAVDRLRALARGDLAQEFPLACRLAAELGRPRILYLATLLHDVGKAIGGRDHANRGADMAQIVGERLGLDEHDREQIAHLVRTHLLMYHVATRRDFDDPGTLGEFVREVRGREGLRELYLLTVADLSTTSPTAMTRWKGKMLDELYVAADRYLMTKGATDHGREAAKDPDEERVAHVRAAVLARIGASSDGRRYVATMPVRYLLSNSVDEIVGHFAVVSRAESRGGLAVALTDDGPAGAAALCVVAPDRPGLLVLITAAITAARLEIHAAQIHSHPGGRGGDQAVDLFWVRGSGAEPEQRERTKARLERDLGDLLAGQKTAESMLEGRVTGPRTERPSPAVGTEVTLDHRASPKHTVLEVVTRDRPGLLYLLAGVLHRQGLSISVAKINTEGTRVADVFYVTEANGTKLAPGPRTDAVRDAFLVLLATEPREEGSAT